LRPKTRRGRNTLHAYRRDLEDFVAFLERRAKPLAAATPPEIGAYMQAQSEAGLAPASRARRLSAIRQLFSSWSGKA
jgi:integrase/recombinase XerD